MRSSFFSCVFMTCPSFFFFFFNDTATTEIYTLSLHDALPILSMQSVKPSMSSSMPLLQISSARSKIDDSVRFTLPSFPALNRSEEHTSELQSHSDLVCRLLLEKKKTPMISLRTYSESNSVFNF